MDSIALRTPWGAGGVASPAAPPGSTYPAHLHEPPIQHRQTTMAPKRAWLGTGRRDLARNHANRAETNRRQLIPPHRCRSKQSGAPADLFRSSSGIGMPVPHMRQLFAPAAAEIGSKRRGRLGRGVPRRVAGALEEPVELIAPDRGAGESLCPTVDGWSYRAFAQNFLGNTDLGNLPASGRREPARKAAKAPLAENIRLRLSVRTPSSSGRLLTRV